jgi:hypothetical protein
MSTHDQNKHDQNDQNDFWTAMGESFGQHISPPVPFEDASAQACCEILQNTLGEDITPSDLASLTTSELMVLADEIAHHFETGAPKIAQLEAAIADTLARWPVGSLGEV